MSPCIGFVMGRLDKQGRFAPMVANQLINGSGSRSRMASAGVRSPSTIRPRVLSLLAISRKSNKLCLDRSVPFGKYWHSSPLVFSLVPCGQGECGSQK